MSVGKANTSSGHMSTLPVEDLYAGDGIIYYRSSCVARDERGELESIVANISSGSDGIELVNGERLSRDCYIKRVKTFDGRSSRLVEVRGTCSRPLSSFTLHEGEIPESLTGIMERGCMGTRNPNTGVGYTSDSNISYVDGGEVQSREVSEALSGDV